MHRLCREGPSAVGKSSTARYLAEHHEVIHVSEVNLLFEQLAQLSLYWYYERQVCTGCLIFNYEAK